MSPRRLLPVLVVLLLAGTLLATAASVRYEQREADQRAAAYAERAAGIIRLSMTVSMDSLDDTAGLFDASDSVAAAEFSAFARRVLARGGLSAVRWVEPIQPSERERYERVTGRPIVVPIPLGSRLEAERAILYPVTFEASSSPTRSGLGVDAATDPVRRAALEAAVATGAAAITPPVALYGSGDSGVAIFRAVYRGGGTPATVAERQRLVRGLAVGGYRLDTLMRTASAAIDPGLPLELRDGRKLLSRAAPGADRGARATVEVGGRRWLLLVGAPDIAWAPPATFFVAGIFLTLLTLALAVTLGRRDRFAREAVARATGELQASRRSQRALVENSPDVVVRCDDTLRCLYANAAIERVTGLPPSAFAGRGLDEVGLPDGVVEILASAIRSVFETGRESDLDYDLIGTDGPVAMHARLAPEPGPDGGVESVLVVSREVTAQRRMEAALRSSEERYRSLVAAMSDGVVLQAGTGTVVACNPAAERILGLTADQMMGHEPVDPSWAIVREDGSPLPAHEHPAMVTLATGTPQREVSMGVRKPDGTRTWISVSTEPIVGDGDASVVCWFSEITARRDVEREQAALRRIATLVAAQAEPGRIFERLAEEAADLVGAESAGVVRFDAARTSGTIMGVWASNEGWLPAPGQTIALTPASATGEVAETGRPARAGDERTAAGHARDIFPRAMLYSAVSAPILVEGSLWGALSAGTTQPRPLPPGMEGRLARLAELASLAIMSASARDELATLAATDHLTGLWNRRAFQERLSAEVERAKRHRQPMTLAMIDIDNFKRVNDLYGHPAGDRVLIQVAHRLFAAVREGEIVARVGGEEFAWILPETDGRDAVEAAERVRRAIAAEPFAEIGQITVSLGVCDLDEGETVPELMRLADTALYCSKSNGRDRVTLFSPELIAPDRLPAS